MDTTTINYALGKIESAFVSVSPHLQNLSEEYVKFVAVKQYAIFGCSSLVTILLVLVLKKLSKNYNSDMDGLIGGAYCSSIAFSIIGIVTFSIVSIVYCSNSILVAISPEMFAISSIIEAAK